MNNNGVATSLCALLLLSACTIASPTPPTVSSSTPTVPEPSIAPSVSPTATSSPTSTGPFPVLRTDGSNAQFAAESVDIDPTGVVTALAWADQLGGNTVVLRDTGDDTTDRELRLYVNHVVQVA